MKSSQNITNGRELQRKALLTRLDKYKGKEPDDKPQFVIAPSFLQLEAKIVAGSTIEFEINPNQTTLTPTEVRLNVGDTFEFNTIKFGLKEIDTSVAYSHGIAKLTSWPNPEFFSTATGFNALHLEAVYNGKLSIMSDSYEFIPGLSMRNFLDVPLMPQGTVTSGFQGSAGTDVTYEIIRDSWGDGMGSYECPASITLLGNSDTKIKISLSGATGAQIEQKAANKAIYAVLILEGVITKGVLKKS